MNNQNDTWGVVELMGHVTVAGKITKPGEYGGLWQIDIPESETFRTEFFGSQSVYRVRIVSEEIARAYARSGNDIIAYDAPIITREEHEAAMSQAREIINELRRSLRLKMLPTGDEREELSEDDDDWNREDD